MAIIFNKKKKAQSLVEESLAKRNQEHFKGALLLLYEAIELDSDNLQAHKMIGEYCFKERNLSRSLEAFNEVMRLDSEDKDAYNYKGKILRRKGQKKEAMEVFMAAIKKFPDYKAPALNLAAMQIGEDIEEAEVSARINMVHPPGKMIIANIGRKIGEEGFKGSKELQEEEIQKMENAAVEHPNWPDTWFNLATARIIYGDYRKAIEGFVKALKIHPRYENALLNLGVAYYYLDEREKAKTIWYKLAKLNKKNKAVYLNLYQMFMKRKAFVPATASLLKAFEAVDDQRDKLMNEAAKAYAFYQNGDLKKAESLFLKLHEMKPKYPDILLYLGNCALKKQELLKAMSYWGQSIQINPNYEAAQNSLDGLKGFMLRLSEKLVREKEYGKALEYLEPLLKLNPESREIATIMYQAYVARRDNQGVYEMEKILAS